MKRFFDILMSIFALCFLSLPLIFLSILIKSTSNGPVIYWSDRIGRNNTIFKMPKFRTMRTDTPVVATHLLTNPDEYLTTVGRFLRKTSLDELPQLYNIIKGEMSFVGPRPALYNQDDLIKLRTEKNVHQLVPGITGWAQINGRDDLPIPKKVEFDAYYLKHRSLVFDMKIILSTIFKVIRREGVAH